MRKRIIGAAIVILVVAAVGAAAWWFSPGSAEFRYSHADLVTLWRHTQDDPKDALAWRELGMRLARQGDPLAEGPLREAHNLLPDDAEVGSALGELLLSEKQIPEAFQILKAVTERHPSFAPAHIALGHLYKRKGSYLHAAEQYEQAVKLDKEDAQSWHDLALCYLQNQQSANAKTAIDQALIRKPNEPGFLALKGSIDVVTGTVDSGFDNLKKASQLAPNDQRIQNALLNALITYHRSPDDLKQARDIALRLQLDSPKSPQLMFQLGEIARLSGNWSDAVHYLEGSLAAAPEKDDTYFSLGQAYARVGRSADAEKMLALHKKRKEVHTKVNDVRVAIGTKPNDASLYKQLATLQGSIGDSAAELDAWRSLLQIDPNNAEAKARVEKLDQQLATNHK